MKHWSDAETFMRSVTCEGRGDTNSFCNARLSPAVMAGSLKSLLFIALDANCWWLHWTTRTAVYSPA